MRWARHQSQALATWLRFGRGGVVDVIVVVVVVAVDLGSGMDWAELGFCAVVFLASTSDSNILLLAGNLGSYRS